MIHEQSVRVVRLVRNVVRLHTDRAIYIPAVRLQREVNIYSCGTR